MLASVCRGYRDSAASMAVGSDGTVSRALKIKENS
jgi:2-phosphoglycerate kinase